MKSLEARKLAELVGSPFAAKLIGAMPEPAVIVSADERAAAANKPALDLLPGLRIGDPFVLGLRAPDVIDARRRVMASGEAETVQWSERVPVERLFEVTVAPLATANGEVVATLITLRDQTEARRVERLRVDFIANASHELRTEPVAVSAMGSALVDHAIGEAGDIDTAAVIMETASGKVAQISNSRRATYGYDQRVEAHGVNGMLSAANIRETTVEWAGAHGFTSDKALNFFLERYEAAYRNELDAFIAAVKAGKKPRPDGEDGLKALLLADAAYRSWKTRQRVAVG